MTGVLDVEDNTFLMWTYGDDVVTVQLSWENWGENEDTIHYAVYNEKFEVVREVRARDTHDLYDIYTPRYLPSQKRWYFNTDDCFYTASEDFSELTKIADFDLRKYYILEDRIVYYRTPYDYYEPEINADIYGEMGLGGKRSIPKITTRKHSAW